MKSTTPKMEFVSLLLKKTEIINPAKQIITSRIIVVVPGFTYNLEIMPKHNGTQIRRNGISLCSTVCSG
jgi:hypothetical protein